MKTTLLTLLLLVGCDSTPPAPTVDKISADNISTYIAICREHHWNMGNEGFTHSSNQGQWGSFCRATESALAEKYLDEHPDLKGKP